MIRNYLLPAGLALACIQAAPAFCQAPTVKAEGAWARATPSSGTTAALYMSLTSPTGDKLVGVTTPAAQAAELHETQMKGNVMEMRPVEGGLALPAGQTVTLRPGGYHIMLMGLKGPLRAGQSLQVQLSFQSAPALDVVAQVRPIGASGPAPGGMPGMPMH